MSARLAVRKLLAFDAGKPLPRGTTLHFPKRTAKDTRVLAFVRMGVEFLRPWGVAIGPPNRAPAIYTVAEARDRGARGGMLEQVGPTLLAHMGHPSYARNLQLPYIWLRHAAQHVHHGSGGHSGRATARARGLT